MRSGAKSRHGKIFGATDVVLNIRNHINDLDELTEFEEGKKEQTDSLSNVKIEKIGTLCHFIKCWLVNWGESSQEKFS